MKQRTEYPPEVKKKVLEAYAELGSIGATASALGISRHVIYGWLRAPENHDLVQRVTTAHAQMRIARYDESLQMCIDKVDEGLRNDTIKNKDAAVALAIIEEKREMLLKQLQPTLVVSDPAEFVRAAEHYAQIAAELERRKPIDVTPEKLEEE